MATSALSIIENEKFSIREFEPGVWGGLVGDGMGILWPSQAGLISPWGTWQCDRDLRNLFYLLHNTLVQGAFDLFCQTFLSTPFEISGGRNQTHQWQDIFFEAEFGEGYDVLMWKALQDYLCLNRGLFLEKVSYGAPDTPLRDGARVLGINHLDPMRIVFTGNLEHPYQYWSEYTGKLHTLHRTRVIHLVHAPTPISTMPGIGKSPLFNIVGQSNAQILLGRYQNELLSDMPPPGLVIFNNIKPENIEQAMRAFEGERRRDGQQFYRAPLRIEGLKQDQSVSVTFVPLASVPSDFDYEKYMRMHVNLVALGTQMDPQDIWPLTSTQLGGTGQQSIVLSRKSQGKGYGYLLTRFERIWNVVLPRALEWKYKAQNHEEGKEQADLAQTWMTTANMASDLTAMERRQLLANQVPQFADVLLDAQGNVRLPDDDPKEPGQEVVVPDDVPAEGEDNLLPEEETTADDSVQLEKEYGDTADAFEDEVAAILADAAEGNINKITFGARMRSAINTYGRRAFLDGLEAGGVETDTLDDDDKTTLAALLAEQSPYVSNVASEIFNTDGGFKGSATFRAHLWVNKTLSSFYKAGLVSADANGLYEWEEGDTIDKCVDCLRMDGQKHRLREYEERNLIPPTSETECGGWNCDCSIKHATGKPRGNWI